MPPWPPLAFVAYVEMEIVYVALLDLPLSLTIPGVFMLCMHAESSSAITTGQPSKCVWLPIQLPYGGVNSVMGIYPAVSGRWWLRV